MEILIIKKNKTLVNWETKSQFIKYHSDANVENIFTKVMKNKRFEKFAIAILGCSLYFQDAFAAAATSKGPDPLGFKLLFLFRGWAKWILLIMCIAEICFSAAKGASDKTLTIGMKYIVIYASMFIIPEIYNAIEESF